MAASPIVASDLDPVTAGATACDHLVELAETRRKMQEFLDWLLTDAGNIDTGFIENVLEFLLPGAMKTGWIVRANRTTGILELASNKENIGDLLEPGTLRINRLQTTSGAVGDLIVFIGADWARHTPFYGAPTEGATVPAAATGGVRSAAHGLSQAPRQFSAVLECATAEHGYAVGDRVDAATLKGRTGGTPENFQPCVVFADASLVGVVFNDSSGGGTYRIVNKTTPTVVNNLTPGSWNVKLFATY